MVRQTVLPPGLGTMRTEEIRRRQVPLNSALGTERGAIKTFGERCSAGCPACCIAGCQPASVHCPEGASESADWQSAIQQAGQPALLVKAQ